MTFEEYEKKIQHAVLNQDEIPVVMQEILAALKTDLTTLDSFKTKNAEQEEKIRTLQESNVKLFLGQTQQTSADKENETGDDYRDMQGLEAVDAFMKENSIEDFIVSTEKEETHNE